MRSMITYRVHNELESFDGRCPAPDYKDFLALCCLAVKPRGVVYFPLEVFFAGHTRYFGVTTRSHSSHYPIETTIGWIINDPKPVFVLGDRGDTGVELGALL